MLCYRTIIFRVPVSLESVLLALSCGINYDKVTNIEVRRGSVFANALQAARRPTFCVSGALKVMYMHMCWKPGL